MKLLQIGPFPPPVGGWSFHIKVFKEYLDDKGIENSVLNMGPNRRLPSTEYVDVQGPVDYILKVFKFCRRGHRVYIHLNGDSVKGFVLTLMAQLIALLHFQRCMLSFHAGVVQVCFYNKFNLQKILAFMVFQLAGGIMCNSEEVKKSIHRFAVSKDKIHAIPCFSVQYLQHQPKITEQEATFIQNHNPIISCYLFFREEYEPDTIIKALAKVHAEYANFGCIFIGSTHGYEQYENLVVQHSLTENVFLAGDKDHDNFLTLIEQSDISLRAHIRDGVCSSVMEALALGVPVIACDNGTRPAEVILFESGNSDDLAAKTLHVLNNLNEMKTRLSGIEQRDAMLEELNMLQSM